MQIDGNYVSVIIRPHYPQLVKHKKGRQAGAELCQAQIILGAAVFPCYVAYGIENKVPISKEAKVVLTANLWPEAKLTNGTPGFVK